MEGSNYKEEIAEILIDIQSIKFSFQNPFILTSGLKSPVYVDCRKIISFIKERNIILNYAKNYFDQNKIEFDLLAGGETAGIPYAAMLSEQLQKRMIYVRKKPKGFGKNQQIEGDFERGQKAILIEDLSTDGGSKVIFIKAMRQAGLRVEDVFVIFYYNIFDITKSSLFDLKVKIHFLCTWKDIISVIEKKRLYDDRDIANLNYFLSNHEDWRKKNA